MDLPGADRVHPVADLIGPSPGSTRHAGSGPTRERPAGVRGPIPAGASR